MVASWERPSTWHRNCSLGITTTVWMFMRSAYCSGMCVPAMSSCHTCMSSVRTRRCSGRLSEEVSCSTDGMNARLYSSSHLMGTIFHPNNTVIREVSFGEREHHVHSWYLVPRMCPISMVLVSKVSFIERNHGTSKQM